MSTFVAPKVIPLRVLAIGVHGVEDGLRTRGFNPLECYEICASVEQARTAFSNPRGFDVVLCACYPEILRVYLGCNADLPFIITDRGTVEHDRCLADRALPLMSCGAHDFVELYDYDRLAQVIRREVRAAAMRRQLRVCRELLGNRDKPFRRQRKKQILAGDDKPTRIAWEGVAGMQELKAMLERDVILPLQEPEIYRHYGLELPNGILLYGPSGCGKTFIARKLAEVAGFNFVEVTPGDLASTYVHGTQEKIAEVFAKARKQAPCMIFLDELDAMVPNRGDGFVSHHYASEVNEFLVQLNESGKNRVLVIGATNLPDRIDLAVRRPGRLDKKFFVAPPDLEARVELLRLYVGNRPQREIDWHYCAVELENYTCAEIEFIVSEAARHALAQSRPIINGDILNAAGNNPPAHSESDLEKMR